MIPGPYPITWRTHCKTSIHIHWGPALPIIVHGNTWIVVFSSIQSLFSLWPPGHTHFILIFFYAFTASSLLELLLIGLPLLQLFNAGVVELDSCIRVNIEFGVEVAWNFNQPIKYLQFLGLHPLFTVSQWRPDYFLFHGVDGDNRLSQIFNESFKFSKSHLHNIGDNIIIASWIP